MLRYADNPVPEANSSLFTFRWRAGAYARGKAHNNMMPPLLDFWFDFASTYSYPMQIAPLAQQAGVMLRFRPFLLGPLFRAQGCPTSQSLSRKGPLYVAGPRTDLR
jgi:hypothetical protein